MTFTVKERFTLLGLLPDKASLDTLRVVREAQLAISFSEDERAALQFVQEPNGGIRWQTAGEVAKDIPLTPSIVTLLLKQLDTLSAKEQATFDQFLLHERLSQATM
jgi:hypothetical protein